MVAVATPIARKKRQSVAGAEAIGSLCCLVATFDRNQTKSVRPLSVFLALNQWSVVAIHADESVQDYSLENASIAKVANGMWPCRGMMKTPRPGIEPGSSS